MSRQRATADVATNKLLRAALVELPEPGQWDLVVECRAPLGDVDLPLTLTAVEPRRSRLALAVVWLAAGRRRDFRHSPLSRQPQPLGDALSEDRPRRSCGSSPAHFKTRDSTRSAPPRDRLRPSSDS